MPCPFKIVPVYSFDYTTGIQEAISQEEEEQFWAVGQLGGRTSKSLLNTVYYYNGKLFGLRHGEHRNITVNNFKVGSNYIEFEENVSKTFHGGLCDSSACVSQRR